MIYVKGCLQDKEIWGAEIRLRDCKVLQATEVKLALTKNVAPDISIRRETPTAMILHLSRFVLFSNTKVSIEAHPEVLYTVNQHGLYTKHTTW